MPLENGHDEEASLSSPDDVAGAAAKLEAEDKVCAHECAFKGLVHVHVSNSTLDSHTKPCTLGTFASISNHECVFVSGEIMVVYYNVNV